MHIEAATGEGLYYTEGHEWIQFQDSVALVGITNFKLLGFKDIDDIVFAAGQGVVRQGELIATIRYHDYEIEARMPVDGTLVECNTLLRHGQMNILLSQPEGAGWLARIMPSQPHARLGLLAANQYIESVKPIHAK